MDKPDFIDVRKFLFETNVGPQQSDIYEIYDNNIKKENITKVFKIEAKGNVKNSFVDDIQLKDDIEIHELKMDYPAEEQIKTETVCNEFQLMNDDFTMEYDFELEQSKLKTEILKFETKMDSGDYFLKEEEITVGDVMDAVDSTEVDEYSEINSYTRPLCNNNQEIRQQTSNEYPSLSEHEVPIERSNDGKIGSSFVRKSSSKMEQNLHNLTKISVDDQLIKLNNGFKCGLCPFQSQLEAQVKVHLENFHYNEFTNQLDVDLLNIVKKHSNEYLLYKCSHCDYKTKSKKFLKRHLKVHSNENVFHKCDYCDFKTNFKNSLKRHLIVHSDENVFHKCEHCDFKTNYTNSLKSHLILHSNENVVHECEHCNFKTKYKRSLKRHLIMHSDEKIFHKCELCDFKTKYKNNLKSHLIVHSNENVFHKCEHCDFKTKYTKNLKFHLVMHSDVFYKCEHCPYKTKREFELKMHLIEHSNENVFYKCEHCDYKTKYKNSFKKHLMVHSG